jgi:DNA-binding SARP family transcriptional activator
MALADLSGDPSAALVRGISESPAAVSSLAELVIARLPDLDPQAFAAVTQEAERRPWRWRPAARRALSAAHHLQLSRLASLLERIGEPEDINPLHEAGRRAGGRYGPKLGLALARRLANRVFVEDLGRLQIVVGDRVVDGSEVRRKVLALLCFLLSRPRFSSTRDEVADNLWPEHDPASALNSLNQTVYFLRRVFEPDFADETSPGYVGQDGETIWLDELLVDCRSKRCLQIIRSMPRDPTPEGSIALATEYRGRFALDFAYEEWSVPYRDALHASYLRVIEHAVRLDLDGGHFDRGTFIAERAAEIDPDSEEIQAALVRLYRHSGAHAAAAEQYAHYAQTVRDLGIEPPDLGDV